MHCTGLSGGAMGPLTIGRREAQLHAAALLTAEGQPLCWHQQDRLTPKSYLNPSGSGGECVQRGASLNTQKAALFPCVSSGKVWKGFLVGTLMRAYQILSTARIRVIDVEKNIFTSPLIWFVLRGFHAWVFFFSQGKNPR